MAKSIKVRAKVRDGETVVKALISHPMETGQRKTQKQVKNSLHTLFRKSPAATMVQMF